MSATENTRWRLNRGGIVNIWAYGERTFDLSGGRAIFQGANGSGKSRTLELLLPLCLDGDLRQLGCKGFDTVSMRRLLLDEYAGTANRIGYAWVELLRTVDGAPEFLTCGIGVKASNTSQQITDSWRFVTPDRVGRRLRLAPDGVPLGPAALREEVGADRVYPEAAFRTRVAELVYGIPAGRYADLLHLQRTLRNPDVGLKVLEGQLEQILSDALPPLDRAMVDRLAGSFEDLESIRENISDLAKADRAFRAFIDSYAGYAAAQLNASSGEVDAAEDAVEKAEREVDELTAELEGRREARRVAEGERERWQSDEDSREERLRALRELPAYHDLEDLRGREKLLEAARSVATASLEDATRQRAAEDAAVDGVTRTLRRLATDCAAATESRETLREHLRAAALDVGDLPEIPTHGPPPDVDSSTERVRGKPEADAEPVAVERRSVRAVDLDGLEGAAAAMSGTVERLGHIERAASEQAALASSLCARAEEMARDHEELRRSQVSARDAQLAATEAAGLRHQSWQELWTAADVWLERVLQWRENPPAAGTETVETLVLPTAEELLDDVGGAADIEASARRWVEGALRSARDRSGELAAELDRIGAVLAERESELVTVRSGKDAVPEPPWFAQDQERDGGCFYRLVDFEASVPDVDRAGIEAALQSCGLLTARVTASGRLPDHPELHAFDPGARPESSLADVLVPAASPDANVPAETVAELLSAVALASDADGPSRGSSGGAAGGTAETMITRSGAWRCGVLTGRWSKPAAEFIGAGARAAARERLATELGDEIEELRTELARAEERCAAAGSEVQSWERHANAFPVTTELFAANAKLRAETDAAERATERAASLRERHEAADARRRAASTELERDASDAGLPSDVTALRACGQSAVDAGRAARSLRQALRGGVHHTLEEVAETVRGYQLAVSEREAAEERAESDCRDFANQSSALETARDAVGGEAAELADSLAELEEQRQRARSEHAAAGERVTRERERAAKLEARVDGASGKLAERRSAVEEASRRFEALVHAPGLLAAVFTGDEDLLAMERRGDTGLLDTVRRALAGDRDGDGADSGAGRDSGGARGTGESTILGKLQTLQSSLAGSHDVVAERHAGVLSVTVAGESGTKPIAVAAREVAEALSSQRGFLDERYQSIFSDYLISDLTEWLRGQIEVADDLTRRMNEVLDGARSSQGVRVRLTWRPAAALDERMLDALGQVRVPYAERSAEQNAAVRAMFTERIEAERESSGGYGDILARALDYRSWHEFTVKVGDTSPEGKPRQRRLRQLSSGETRLVSYVTLFAAAAAFYDAVSEGAGASGVLPLRLVLLDEAFERLDDPTVARLLGLLVDLDMDWVITWPSGWGVSEKIPRMHIYDVLRSRDGGAVACIQTTWDGAGVDRVEDP